MLRTSIVLVALAVAPTAMAAECPRDRAELGVFLSSFEEIEQKANGAGIDRKYKVDGKLRVLGVRPRSVMSQEVWDDVGRLSFYLDESPARTRDAFQAAFPGATCAQDDDSCEWKAQGELVDGQLEYARTQDLFGQTSVFLCDYR